MNTMSPERIFQRSVDVAVLKTRTYAEIARDPRATLEAAIIVILVAISAGIGNVINDSDDLIGGIILSLLGWIISSAIIYFIGTNLTGTPTTSGSIESLLRTLGYASAPNIFLFLGFVWLLGGIIVFLLSIWTLVTTIFAIRSALSMSLGRAVVTGFVALLAATVIQILLGMLFGINVFVPF